MGEMLRRASWSNQPKSVVHQHLWQAWGRQQDVAVFGVKAQRVGRFNRSASDLLKDSLIKMTQLIPIFNYTMQEMTDKSVCANRYV